ncbi:DUF3598 family protein [Nocardioides yefusunii]|uniref:DUF3598 family protein n=1 Tax=Nocardioides yefusunii TaxID=2500546 RepID=A0ABW1R0Q8_9ACTN|nr:DUF3598 family protein [Nocardioides yefusunii]
MNAWDETFPILNKHIGEWEGEYVHLDPDGNEIDRHASHLKMWAPTDGSADIKQINTYTWADGRQHAFEFPGTLDGEKVRFDDDRIAGYMYQTDERTIMLTWTYKELLKEGNYLYELIQLSSDGQQKVRTWHWMEDDRLVKRTVIREKKIA